MAVNDDIIMKIKNIKIKKGLQKLLACVSIIFDQEKNTHTKERSFIFEL
jgi:hypothetical protein